MNSKNQKGHEIKQSLFRRLMHTALETMASILGGALVLICAYWFFHFDTWHERFIYITLSIVVVYLICKVLPDRPE
jgi:uncharacterized membrane protein YsdA (DUF1294 family)